MEIRMGLVMGGKDATIGKIEVKVGDSIEPGQTLLNTETRKGNRPLKAMAMGVITKICIEEGDKVKAGDILFEYEESENINISSTEEILEKKKKIEQIEIDLVIIGAGPGGYVSAIYAAQRGLEVVLIERENLGGTCLNHGCIPTKTLLQSAQIYEMVKNAERFGVKSENTSFDIKKIIERKESVCKENRDGISFLLNSNNIRVISGEAILKEKKEVFVVSHSDIDYEIKAKNIILATGSKSLIPSWAESSVCIDSKKALGNLEIPNSIVIIGGGVIGMEFAFMYSAYGSKVRVLEYADHILGNIDKQAASILIKSAKKKGIDIQISSKVIKIIKSEDNKAIIFYEKEGKEYLLSADKVLVSTGRIAEFNRKNMDSIGIEYDGRGIKTDNNYETNIKDIYVIGDANGKSQLAHSASNQGIAVIDKIAKIKKKETIVIPSVIFTSPEIAGVGLTEEECIKKGLEIKVSLFPFTANGKAKIQDETEGFVKLIKEKKSDKIIGGVIVGPDASALIAIITLAITNNLTDKQITDTIFAHPTTAEAVWEAAEGLSLGAIHYHE